MSQIIEIYVAMHKEGKRPIENEIYQYVQGGSAINKKVENVIYDDCGDNISELNPFYCELTVQYWAWKNSKADIKGMCHYRRFFSTSYVNQNSEFFLDKTNILTSLKNNNIILPIPVCCDYKKVKESYLSGDCGKTSDLDVLSKVIKEQYPDYFPAYERIMDSYKISYCNMLIAPRKIFDEYSKWLFDVLKKVEPYIDMNERQGNEKRIYGYLSERLLNVWVLKNKLRVKYYPVVMLSGSENKIYRVKCLLDLLKLYRPLQLLKDYIKLGKVKIKEKHNIKGNTRIK